MANGTVIEIFYINSVALSNCTSPTNKGSSGTTKSGLQTLKSWPKIQGGQGEARRERIKGGEGAAESAASALQLSANKKACCCSSNHSTSLQHFFKCTTVDIQHKMTKQSHLSSCY